MKTFVLIFFFIVANAENGYSQTNSTSKFSLDQLKENFGIFQGSLEDFHPGIYWYRSKEVMDSIFEASLASLEIPLTEREFLRQLSAIKSKIGCGHTDVRLSEKTRELKGDKFFPLKLIFRDNRAFFLQNNDNDSLSILLGEEILSINNLSTDSLISVCKNVLSRDGYITTGNYFILNNFFRYVYANFFDQPKSYTMDYLTKNNERKTLALDAVKNETISKNEKGREGQTEEDRRNLILELTEGTSTAILSVKHFSNWIENGKRVSINNRMQEIFEELASSKIDNLIIDVRNNGGGKEPWRLLAYFYPKQFVFASRAEFTFSKNSEYYTHQELHPSMKWIKRPFNMGSGSLKIKKLNDSLSISRGHFMVKPFEPLFPQFRGNVFIIANGGSFSATSLFVASMKSRQLAAIVGKETGGSYYGNTAMSPTFVTLPNTKLKLEIPLIKFSLNVEKIYPLGKGVLPDYPVNQDLEDQLNGVDTPMNFTLDLIKGIDPK